MPTLEWREQTRRAVPPPAGRGSGDSSLPVNTTPENIEDACMFAWMQSLTHQLEEPTAVGSWLLTVARREAISARPTRTPQPRLA